MRATANNGSLEYVATFRMLHRILKTRTHTARKSINLPMRKTYFILLTILLSCQTNDKNETVNPSDYLNRLKTELKKEWPNNSTINLVFHGHSVPAGYFKTPIVNTLESYPFLVLKE